MTTTDANGIVYLQDTDDISPFHTLINVLQAGTSNALNARIRIARVANVTERNALATTLGASPTNPIYTHRIDALAGYELERTINGSTWIVVGGSERNRSVPVAISGTLSVSLDIAPTQIISASPFGSSAFSLRVNTSMAASIPSGLGAQLDIIIDGTVVATNRATNGGGTSHTATLTADKTTVFSDALNHSARVTITPLGGSINILTGTFNFFDIHGAISAAL